MRRTVSSILKLGRDERGTSIVEFAFVVPIFAMMVVGVGDLARGVSERHALQQAVNRTLEMAHLGTRQDNYEFLRTEAAEAAADAGKTGATVTLTSWLDCINNDGTKTKKAWAETCSDTQETARYITLTLASTFEPSFGTAGYLGVTAGKVPISASASVRVQ